MSAESSVWRCTPQNVISETSVHAAERVPELPAAHTSPANGDAGRLLSPSARGRGGPASGGRCVRACPPDPQSDGSGSSLSRASRHRPFR